MENKETIGDFIKRESKSGNESVGIVKGAKWQQEQIGKSEFLQKLRATKSDAEARRLIFETLNK